MRKVGGGPRQTDPAVRELTVSSPFEREIVGRHRHLLNKGEVTSPRGCYDFSRSLYTQAGLLVLREAS